MMLEELRTKTKTSIVMSRARSLVNTSADDMQRGLWNYKTREDLRVLAMGLIIVKQRGEKTKTRMLTRRIKQVREGLGLP